jgi:hypothetical protein
MKTWRGLGVSPDERAIIVVPFLRGLAIFAISAAAAGVICSIPTNETTQGDFANFRYVAGIIFVAVYFQNWLRRQIERLLPRGYDQDSGEHQ